MRNRGGTSVDNEDFIKQLRENLTFLENQRQYLTKDLDATRKDNKELEYIREEQVKELNNLRSRLQTVQEANLLSEERADANKQRVQELEKINQDLAQTNAFLKDQLNGKTNELI